MQTKFASAPQPTQRVLSQVRERPAPAAAAAPPGLSPETLNSLPVLGPDLALAEAPTGLTIPVTARIGGPNVPVLLAPVTPLVDVPGGNPGIPQPPIPAPAVPEPLTWVTLLTGLAALSGILRRERRRGALAVASAAR